jgi:coproporphyrinogen III oxidase-like Fe-S oxidoreductase
MLLCRPAAAVARATRRALCASAARTRRAGEPAAAAAASSVAAFEPALSAYVHIPFCRRRCGQSSMCLRRASTAFGD